MGESGLGNPEGFVPLAEWLAGLAVVEREIFFFAAFWLVLGALDELAVDLTWIYLRLTGRIRTEKAGDAPADLSGLTAVFIPAWHEASVLATTIEQIGQAWPQPQVRLFVGVYANDPGTLTAARIGAADDSRVRIVVLDRAGPTTKADCLNFLYHTMEDDEARRGEKYRAVILQDAEDMVHPAGIGVIDRELDQVEMVQLSVQPAIAPSGRAVSGHYADEFAESHGKAMIVRDALGLDLPAAGVGTAFQRGMLDLLASQDSAGPFAQDSLTEDYELGFRIRQIGGSSRFVRARDARSQLIGTRSYFPNTLGTAARQKARWIHGIAFQGWDRLGWTGSWANRWMMLRDRRGPLAALVLSAAYLLFAIEMVLIVSGTPRADYAGMQPWVLVITAFLTLSLVWRTLWRAAFVTRDYGWREGGWSMLRIPIANVIGIMAGCRALAAYVGSLLGHRLFWDKTLHDAHPALIAGPGPLHR